MSEFPFPSPAVWLNSGHVERWLRGLWPSWRSGDVRHSWDSAGRWFWLVPDFHRGRTRVLGIRKALLEQTTVSKLQSVLEADDWLERIDESGLLVDRTSDGAWSVTDWNPELPEKWFAHPQLGNFVAFVDEAALVSTAPPPARLPEPFLALHGWDWSAKGPEHPRDPTAYDLEELEGYLPKQGR